MKTFYICLLIAVSALVGSACQEGDGDYEMMDPAPSQNFVSGTTNGEIKTGMGTIARIEATGAILMEQDNGTTAIVTNPALLTNLGAKQSGERYFYTYRITTLDNTVYIELLEAYPVILLTLEDEVDDEKADAPVSIVGQNISGHYLNLQFQYRTQESGSNSHRFHLTSLQEQPDGDGHLPLEFRHDANGNRQEVVCIGYASLLLSELPGYREGTLKQLSIRYNDLEGKQGKVELAVGQ